MNSGGFGDLNVLKSGSDSKIPLPPEMDYTQQVNSKKTETPPISFPQM
jgi:hypothetical protein